MIVNQFWQVIKLLPLESSHLTLRYTHNFQGIGKLKNHSVKLHVNTEVKPIATPPRSVPYHLKERVSRVIEDMIKQDTIEEHPINEAASWVSNAVIAPKPDGSIRMTLDACNVNKAILPTNHPIPQIRTSKPNWQDVKYSPKWTSSQPFGRLNLIKHLVT